MLVHINKRFKSRPQVQLPVEELIEQYRDPNISHFVTVSFFFNNFASVLLRDYPGRVQVYDVSLFLQNFSILYIKMGFPRLPSEKQKELLPQLLQCIKGHPEPQQNRFVLLFSKFSPLRLEVYSQSCSCSLCDSLLQLITPALQYLKFPKNIPAKQVLYGSAEEDKQTSALLLDFMSDMLLLPYKWANLCWCFSSSELSSHRSLLSSFASLQPRPKTAQPSGAAAAAAPGPSRPASAAQPSGSTAAGGPPPGFSEVSFKRVKGENPPTPEELEKVLDLHPWMQKHQVPILALRSWEIHIGWSSTSHLCCKILEKSSVQ